MWRINNDADVFSWQLTSWLVDNCSERSVVFPLQCWQELCVRGKGRRGRKTKLSNLWSVKCCTVHECTKISSSSFLFEVIDNNVVRERLIAVLIQSWLVMIKVSTFQLMVTGGYVIWKQLYWEHVENGFHSEWPEHAGGPHPPTVGGGLAKSTSSGAGVIPARHRQGYQQLFHHQTPFLQVSHNWHPPSKHHQKQDRFWKKEFGKCPLSIVPFLSLLQITPRADSNT